MKKLFTIILVLILSQLGFSASESKAIYPMLGYVEHKEACITFNSPMEEVDVYLKEKGSKSVIKFKVSCNDRSANLFKVVWKDLKPNTSYEYTFSSDFSPAKIAKKEVYYFTTKEIWEYRKPAPNFSFLFGSCLYLNDSAFDRPGKPYGGSKDILKTMEKDSSDFHIWTGDNHYYREADFTSESGLNYRFEHDRATPELRNLLSSVPNYAIWDDHDFGPNDANSSFKFKDRTNTLFQNFWGNPTYGNANKEGIYGNFQYSDVEFFMMDDRYFRSQENYPDSINGQPNPNKHYWGNEQLEWLKNALLTSNATFKIIINGNQVLNKNIEVGECFTHFSAEYVDFMNFLSKTKINGLLIISGDRHFSEVLKVNGYGLKYPIYEITCSPLTSGPYKGLEKSKEGQNPLRVNGSLIMDQNYGKISVFGQKNNRILNLKLLGIKGENLFQMSINQNELK